MTTLKSEGSAELSLFTFEVLHRLTGCGRMIKLDKLEGLNVLVILSQNLCLRNMAELNGAADPVFFFSSKHLIYYALRVIYSAFVTHTECLIIFTVPNLLRATVVKMDPWL